MRRHFLKTILFGSAALSLTSCAAIIEANKSLDTSSLKIGMTKAEAQQALGKKPDSTIAAKKLPGSGKAIEVVQYTEPGTPGTFLTYWLYFIDNHLDRWEPANSYGPAI